MLKSGLVLAALLVAPTVHADITFVRADGAMGETFASKKDPCFAAGVAFQPGDQVVNVAANIRQVCTSDATGARWVDMKVPVAAVPAR